MQDDHKYIDTLIGQKIKHRRNQLSLSQAALGSLMGISAQQIQRYESGENTLNLNRLLPLANFLNVKPDYFLADLPEQHIEAEAQTVSRGLSRPLRILFVEDDENDVLLFEKAITRSGHLAELTHIQRPEEVIPSLSANKTPRPDLIILDINMPRITGIQLLQQIKQSAHKQIPVIMLTNSVRAQDMVACYDAHASGFIQKSADLYEYYQDIERILAYWGEITTLPTPYCA